MYGLHSVWFAALTVLAGQDPERIRPFLAVSSGLLPNLPFALFPSLFSPTFKLPYLRPPVFLPGPLGRWALAGSPSHCSHSGVQDKQACPSLSRGSEVPWSSQANHLALGFSPPYLQGPPTRTEHLEAPLHAGLTRLSMAGWARLGQATVKNTEKLAQDVLYLAERALPLWNPAPAGRQGAPSCGYPRETIALSPDYWDVCAGGWSKRGSVGSGRVLKGCVQVLRSHIPTLFPLGRLDNSGSEEPGGSLESVASFHCSAQLLPRFLLPPEVWEARRHFSALGPTCTPGSCS